jgi:hypothetical protein
MTSQFAEAERKGPGSAGASSIWPIMSARRGPLYYGSQARRLRLWRVQACSRCRGGRRFPDGTVRRVLWDGDPPPRRPPEPSSHQSNASGETVRPRRHTRTPVPKWSRTHGGAPPAPRESAALLLRSGRALRAGPPAEESVIALRRQSEVALRLASVVEYLRHARVAKSGGASYLAQTGVFAVRPLDCGVQLAARLVFLACGVP